MRAAYAEVKRQQGDWNPQTPLDRQDLGGGHGSVLPEDEGWMLQRMQKGGGTPSGRDLSWEPARARQLRPPSERWRQLRMDALAAG